jgi:adenylate cyclase
LIGGTVGNRHRLNYSLFGDTVNIAARLESMTKALPETATFRLLLSADTYQYAQDYFPLQLFQSSQLRGRTGHTAIYTIAEQPLTEAKASQPAQLVQLAQPLVS